MPSSINRSFLFVLSGVTLMAGPAIASDKSKRPPAGGRSSLYSGPSRQAATLTVDAAGKILSCKDEAVGNMRDVTYRCANFAKIGNNFGYFARGDDVPNDDAVGTDLMVATVESSVSFDGGAQLPMTYEEPNRVVTSSLVLHYEVNTAGKVQNCKVVLLTGSSRPPDPCSSAKGPFSPPPARTLGVTLKVAISHPGPGAGNTPPDDSTGPADNGNKTQ